MMDDATRSQINAADPSRSTWVSANAGSGKTRVLTDRVARLLFNGTDPQKILCLTYTKAAASEMQNRLFERLGAWAMMPDEKLRKTLSDLGEEAATLDDETLNKARTLFAAALETPGGLKIQTIHAFCDALLRRFPLEAGVSPQFQILEDRSAEQLRESILDDLAQQKPKIFTDMAKHLTANEADGLVKEILSNRTGFTTALKPEDFGISPSETFQTLIEGVDISSVTEALKRLVPILEASSPMDQKAAVKLKAALQQPDPLEQIKILETVLLFGKNKNAEVSFRAKIDKFPTKAIRDLHLDIMEQLNPFMERIEDARKRRLALVSLQKSSALTAFAQQYLKLYEVSKAMRGFLDYEDLIQKTNGLLTDPSLAQWVLYRLDGGIDHILVDEAQDTSPDQWNIVTRLAEEFTSGHGASLLNRTLFVVGDEKQSIYSFQGADPAEFTRMQNYFRNRLRQTNAFLNETELLYSFRSAEPILQLTDAVFREVFTKQLEAESKEDIPTAEKAAKTTSQHHAFFKEQTGRVDLWPFLEVEKEKIETPWFEPIDTPSPQDPKQILAQKIAQYLKDLLDSGATLQRRDGPSRIRPKDILILVQRRSVLFHALIREMKALGLPVAGADRLEINGELAVQDILSLLRFLATPEDDLSLAEVLRSPLIGLSEEDLFKVAHARPASLWENLRGSEDEFPMALRLLWDMLSRADFRRPYELIERLLTHHKGRENLLARLGGEVEDAIDELLTQALRYETNEVPTQTGFLAWFDAGKVEIKREMDANSDQIRVMTVHGAKGLEAPIVILPDTADSSRPPSNQLLDVDGKGVIWKSLADEATPLQAGAQSAKIDFEKQERLRLLYVAITRAEYWLIVCGAGGRNKDREDWYSRVEDGLAVLDTTSLDHPTGSGIALLSPNWKTGASISDDTEAPSDTDLPSWWAEAAATVPQSQKPLSPSGLAGAKTLIGEFEGDETALQRGSDIHALMEHLPQLPENSWETGRQFLVPTMPSDLSDRMLRILRASEFQWMFGPDALAEVSISVPDKDTRIEGVIDRLVVTPKKVTVIDYKSNTLVPSVPEQTPLGYLAQMGAYLFALQTLYPDREIEVGLLWTTTATYMPLPHNIVNEAFVRATTS